MRQTRGQGHPRGRLISQHIPAAVTLPHGALACPHTASQWGRHKTTTHGYLKAHSLQLQGNGIEPLASPRTPAPEAGLTITRNT